jgi:hypothetical protein
MAASPFRDEYGLQLLCEISSLKGDVALKKIVIHVQGEDVMLWQYNDSTFPFEMKPGALCQFLQS